MKKIFKVMMFILLINAIVTFGGMGYIFISVTNTSVKETGMSVMDLFNSKEHSTEQFAEFKENMLKNSSAMGSVVEKKFEGFLSILVPPKKNNNNSNKPTVTLLIEDPTEQINAATKKGIEEGLKFAEENNNH